MVEDKRDYKPLSAGDTEQMEKKKSLSPLQIIYLLTGVVALIFGMWKINPSEAEPLALLVLVLFCAIVLFGSWAAVKESPQARNWVVVVFAAQMLLMMAKDTYIGPFALLMAQLLIGMHLTRADDAEQKDRQDGNEDNSEQPNRAENKS